MYIYYIKLIIKAIQIKFMRKMRRKRVDKYNVYTLLAH